MSWMKSSEDRNIYKLFSEGCADGTMEFLRGTARKRLGKISEFAFEFFVPMDSNFNIEQIVGKKMSAETATFSGGVAKVEYYRRFSGVVMTIEEVKDFFGHRHFVAEVRPEMWLMSQTYDNRIFQDKSAVDIITEVLRDNDITDFKLTLSGHYEKREYCVQYNESDLTFIQRLMEEEGIYYQFEYPQDQGHKEIIDIRDDTLRHTQIDCGQDLPVFIPEETEHGFQEAGVYEWTVRRHATFGQVTLQDYDFKKPPTSLLSVSKIPKGNFPKAKQEVYLNAGHHDNTALGKARAKVKMEAEAVRFAFRSALSTEQTMAVGRSFRIRDVPVEIKENESEFMVVEIEQYFQGNHDFNDFYENTGGSESSGDSKEKEREQFEEEFIIKFPKGAVEKYYSYIEFIPKKVPYRSPLETPWHQIIGIQTAQVVGPSGQEIHTDKYGRIKVQFHWDRKGKKNEYSSCWLRVMTPWAGKTWGMVALPRIGQEVVVQFEEGNPDRPLCVGMVYNQDNMVPWSLPDNMTQTGIKTNSSKGGGGYNELMFEDKKGKELVRFQAEKDYTGLIKNDHTETIKNKYTETITSDFSTTVKEGDLSVDVKMGKITIKAMKSIELKVGGSTIKMTPSQIEMKSPMVKINGSGLVDVKSSGLVKINGSLVKIN